MSTTESDFGSVQSAATHDVVMQRINQLQEMVAAGIIKKEDLPAMIKTIYLGASGASGGSPPSSPPDPEEKNVTKVLRESSRSFRRPASPETRRLRSIIEAPIIRRFELQCATPDSVLFGKVPPKRLEEAVFNIACEDPLEEIYINNAKVLSKIPSAKVISVIKWKVRKMRGNLVKKGVAKEGFYHDDGFDWDSARKLAPRKLSFQPTPTRGFVRVSRKRKIIKIEPDDSETPSDPEMQTPQKPASSEVPKPPAPHQATVSKRKCGKCGQVSVPYPLDMDWTSNTSAVPYCQKCFSSLEKQCEDLTLKPKEKTSDRRKVLCFIIFDLVLFSPVLSVFFNTSIMFVKTILFHSFACSPRPRSQKRRRAIGAVRQ